MISAESVEFLPEVWATCSIGWSARPRTFFIHPLRWLSVQSP